MRVEETADEHIIPNTAPAAVFVQKYSDGLTSFGVRGHVVAVSRLVPVQLEVVAHAAPPSTTTSQDGGLFPVSVFSEWSLGEKPETPPNPAMTW